MNDDEERNDGHAGRVIYMVASYRYLRGIPSALLNDRMSVLAIKQ